MLKSETYGVIKAVYLVAFDSVVAVGLVHQKDSFSKLCGPTCDKVHSAVALCKVHSVVALYTVHSVVAQYKVHSVVALYTVHSVVALYTVHSVVALYTVHSVAALYKCKWQTP